MEVSQLSVLEQPLWSALIFMKIKDGKEQYQKPEDFVGKKGLENRIEPVDVKDIEMRSDVLIDNTYHFIYNFSESLYIMFH